jgi:hypothetical protein
MVLKRGEVIGWWVWVVVIWVFLAWVFHDFWWFRPLWRQFF